MHKIVMPLFVNLCIGSTRVNHSGDKMIIQSINIQFGPIISLSLGSIEPLFATKSLAQIRSGH